MTPLAGTAAARGAVAERLCGGQRLVGSQHHRRTAAARVGQHEDGPDLSPTHPQWACGKLRLPRWWDFRVMQNYHLCRSAGPGSPLYARSDNPTDCRRAMTVAGGLCGRCWTESPTGKRGLQTRPACSEQHVRGAHGGLRNRAHRLGGSHGREQRPRRAGIHAWQEVARADRNARDASQLEESWVCSTQHHRSRGRTCGAPSSCGVFRACW